MAVALGWVAGWIATGAYYLATEYGAQLLLGAMVLRSRSEAKKAARQANERALAALAAQDRTQMVRTPIGTRKTVYGQARISGPITFLHVTDSNRYLHIVITLTDHEVEAIDDVYFDNERLQIDPAGNVGGKYAGYAVVAKGLGSTAGDAALHSTLTANVGTKWTADHKQTGCAKVYVRLAWNRDIYSGIPNISAVVRGKKIYDPRTATTYYSNNAALCIRDYLLNTETGLGATSAELDDAALIAAANICDEAILRAADTEPFTVPGLAPSAPIVSTRVKTSGISATFGGIASGIYSYVVTFVTASGETAPSAASANIDNDQGGEAEGQAFQIDLDIPRYTGVDYTVTARKLYRTDLNNAGPRKLVTTINDNTTTRYLDDVPDASRGADAPAADSYAVSDVLLRGSRENYYRTGEEVRVSSDGALPAATPSLSAGTTYYAIYVRDDALKLATSLSNALAGTAVNLTGFGSGTHTLARYGERRYTCDGMVDCANKPKDVLEAGLLTALAGRLAMIGGQWQLYAGAYRTPTVTLDESHLDGAIKVSTRTGRRDIFNAVKGVIVNPGDFWQPIDFPPYQSATYKAEDNDELIWKDIELPFTLSPATAQRLAKLDLERARQQITVLYPANLKALTVQAGDTINLTNTRLGWSAKPFEVVDFKFVVRSEADNLRLGIDLFLRETAAAVYDWNDGLETLVDPAPNTDLPNPFIVETPANLTLESGTDQLYLRNDGTVFSRIRASWDTLTDYFVLSGGRIEVQFSPASVSTWQDAAAVPGDQTEAFVLDVQDTVEYDVRIRAVNAFGNASAWVEGTHTVIGKTTPPVNVAFFQVSQNGNVVVFVWSQVADVDLAGYEIRYGKRELAPAWADATPLTSVTRGTQVTTAAVPPGDFTFFIKARDTSGNYSAAATARDLVVQSALDVIYQQEQAPDWLGTKTGFVRHWTGKLIPDDQNPASDYDGFEWCDTFVPTPVADCYYEAPEVDIGFDDTARVWASMGAYLGPNETAGVADPRLEVDYKLAAGAYDGFEEWTVGDRRARYFKQRLHLETARGQAVIESFLPTVDQLERTESVPGVVIAPGGSTVTFQDQFHRTPNVVAVAVGGSALFATVLNVTEEDFECHVWNSSGSDVGGTINYDATGV